MDKFALAKDFFFDGLALFEAEQFPEAEESFRKSLELIPGRLSTMTNLSSVLIKQKKFGEAKNLLNEILAADVNDTEAWHNQGVICSEEANHAEALACFDRVLAINPNDSKASYNRGNILKKIKQFQAAIECYERAIALDQDYADAWLNRGNVLAEIKDYSRALDSYQRAYALMPKAKYLLGGMLHTRMKICDWSTYKEDLRQIVRQIAQGETICSTFPLLGLVSSLSIQRQAAEIYVADMYPEQPVLGPIPKRRRHNKIRVGYYSADFHNHATAYLMAELFELHDRDKFELVGISFGPATDDEMRRRITLAFGRFIDVREKSDLEVARMSRDLEIDIAVDLKGYTQDCRPGIFACRAAPIQANYLGFPGTMGATYIDYLIADKTVIPAEDCRHYAEKIVWLPDSYQVNDAKRQIADRVFTREELGLPARGFVFCCFNNNWKITPPIFDGWMRILKQVDGSVLWLFEENVFAANNLRKEAIARGVDANRLIFAGRMPLADHLARHRAADLFLDTLPYNAHTTTSDALWTGLPVLTCIGEAFAGRVAASLLNAIGAPELITLTQQEYETAAVALASNPERLMQIRKKLARNRLTTPLFDTPRFTRNLETAFTTMFERYLSGQTVENISIET